MESSLTPRPDAGRKVTIDQAFDIDPHQNQLICFTGAGGKTTTLFRMARALKQFNTRVLVTTTTAFYYPPQGECDEVIVNNLNDCGVFSRVKEGSIIVFGSACSAEGKLMGADKGFIDDLFEKSIFNCILVEGDGSRQRPIKAPALHEPVIPGNTTKAVGVVGLDALGRRIDSEWVHRPEIFCKVTGSRGGALIDEETVARLIVSPEGLFKSVPDTCPRYVLLNKAENRNRQLSAMSIIDLVKKSGSGIAGFLVATMSGGSINRIE